MDELNDNQLQQITGGTAQQISETSNEEACALECEKLCYNTNEAGGRGKCFQDCMSQHGFFVGTLDQWATKSKTQL